jgi:hypothetical protein
LQKRWHLILIWIVTNMTFVDAQIPGRVFGTVFVPYQRQEAVLPNVIILFHGPRGRITQADSNQEGNYEISLPPGFYQVTTLRTGFCLERRADFEIKPGIQILFNLNVTSCPTHVGSPLQSQLIRGDRVHPEGARVIMLTFGSRVVRSRNVEYHGQTLREGWARAMVSYQAIAIHADTLVLQEKSLQVHAMGNVIVEDGKERLKATEADIDFEADDPLASLRMNTN